MLDNSRMEIISTDTFQSICHDRDTKTIKFGKSLDQPKVFEQSGSTIIKLFYRKKSRLSSDHIRPRAMRFYKNVNKLHTHGYAVPRIDKIQFCPELKIYLLYYAKIEGKDVRYLANHGDLHVISHVAKLMADLHVNGIFFRSIHLENLLYQPDGKMALLDVTDVRFKSRPLNLYERYRNLKHLFKEPYDRELWQAYGIANFMREYFETAQLSRSSERILTYLVARMRKALIPG